MIEDGSSSKQQQDSSNSGGSSSSNSNPKNNNNNTMSVVVDVIPIQLDTKPKEFIDLYTKANPLPNAKPKTPLLCHYYYHKREGENVKDEATETTILCESTVIVDYLVDVFAMSESSSLESKGSMSLFVPTNNPSDRAIIKLFNHTFVDKAFKYSTLLKALFVDEDEKLVNEAIHSLKQDLMNINAFLTRYNNNKTTTTSCSASSKKDNDNNDTDIGPFLFGSNEFTIAECHMAPYVVRCCILFPEYTSGKVKDKVIPPSALSSCASGGGRTGIVDPLQLCEELDLPLARNWINGILQRPSVIRTTQSKHEMIHDTNVLLDKVKSMMVTKK